MAMLTLSVAAYGTISALPASAAPPDVTAPERVYTGVNQPMSFDGTVDPISDDTRAITVDLADGAVCHTDPTSSSYSISGCSRAQLDLSTAVSGLMFIPGSTTATTQYTGNTKVIVAASGAIIDQATDPNGGPSQVYHISGSAAQINDTLGALEFHPAQDFETTSVQPTILHIVAVNGNAMGGNAQHDVEIKVEGTNGAPTLTVPATPIDANASTDPSDSGVAYPIDPADPPLADVVDPEMCNMTVCGAGYANPGGVEDDDLMLLVGWLDPTCGMFHFRGGSFAYRGGVLNPTVLGLLTNDDIGQNPGLELAGEQAAPILAALGLQAQTVNLQPQSSDVTNLTNAWAGIGSLDEVKYAMSQITYKAPTMEQDCVLNIAVSDLGNSGMPALHGYVGSPIGGMDQPQPGYEIPDAKADVQAITFHVKDTHPDVTVEQTKAGSVGDPTNSPAEFTVTFDQQVQALTPADLTLTGASVGQVTGIMPSGPATSYDVLVTPSPDNTVTVSLAANAVHASAAPMDGNDASTSMDNSITFDSVAPTAAVSGAVTQSAAPVLFTVDFTDDVQPPGLTSSGVVISGTAGVGMTAVVTPLTAHSFQVAVTGMAVNGSVVATVSPGAVDDLAGNPSLTGTFTVAWTGNNALDSTPPTVTVEQSGGQADPATALPIQFTATFDEPVTGFSGADVAISGTAAAGATASVTGGPAIYTIDIGNVSQTGTIVASIPAASVTDLSLNPNTASTSTDHTVLYNKPGLATHVSITAPSNVARNVPFNVVVTALDASNATATGYAGTIHLTSTDGSAVLPANAMLVNGTTQLSVTLHNIADGNYTVSATDIVTASITGTSAAIALSAAVAPATHLAVTANASTAAGSSLSVTVTALDSTNATVTSYAGAVHLSSSDGAAILAADTTLVNGTKTFSVTLKTAGARTLVATDTVTASITGSVVGGVMVVPAAATHLVVTAPASGTTSVPIAVGVTAKDAYNNTATAYAGTVHFTSSDGAAVLPADSMLVNGTKAFSATLATAGSRTVTATDTLTASINGVKTIAVVAPAATTHFAVTMSPTATAGSATSFTVSALDASNALTTGYSGTVHFVGSGVGTTVPADSTLTNGTGTFMATFLKSGNQTAAATDTVTPSITGTGTTAVTAGAAVALLLAVPATVHQSIGFNAVVSAVDTNNNVVTGYATAVQMTSDDVAAGAVGPAMLVNGTGAIPMTLETPGTVTVTATSGVLMTAIMTTVDTGAPLTADHFTVTAGASAIAGIPTTVTVVAAAVDNSPTTAYSGPVTLTSSDPAAVLPVSPMIVNGTGVFSVTLTTAGSRTVTATHAGLTGSTLAVTVAAGAATHFTVSAPAAGITNASLNVTVTAFDASGNVADAYGGLVHFTSTDPAAVLPGDSALTNGIGAFLVTPKTAGSRTVTSTDTVTASINGTTAPIAVAAPLPATHFSVTPSSATPSAGAPFTVTVSARDVNDIATVNYSGSVHFTSSDGAATLPANLVLVNGIGTASVTLKSSGAQTVTATDTLTPSKNGVTGPVTVAPLAAAHLSVTAPATASNGFAVSVTVTALDQFNNVATAYPGTVTIASSDGAAMLPAGNTLSNGVRTFAVTFATNGNQTVTATDTVSSSITGVSGAVAVSPAPPPPATHFAVTAPASGAAGTAVSVTVTALDATNAATSGYSGTVHVTSSDAAATLPADTVLVNGVGIVSVTLRTAGNESVTATDTVTASIAGTSGVVNVTAGPATHLSVTVPASATSGAPVSAIVRALDQFGNIDTGYSGSVQITSTDPSAVLPATNTLSNGVGAFPVTLIGLGTHTVTATDAVDSTLAGTSAAINVSNVAQAPATHLSVSGPASATANVGFTFTVTALDASNGTASGYSGTVHFTSTSAGSVPADVALVNGVGVFSATLTGAGSQTITATDTSTPSIAGTSGIIAVAAGSAAAFVISTPVLLQIQAFNPFTRAVEVGGRSYVFTVSAVDHFGNVATSYNGVVHFSSDDPTAVLPADVTLVNGFGTFTAVFNRIGSNTISVSDPANPAIAAVTVSGVLVAADPTPADPVVTPTMPAGGVLPATGGNSFSILWLAGLLLITGCGVLGGRTLRRRTPSSRL